MNTPTTDGIRVPAARLRASVRELMATAGLVEDESALLADLLVANSLGGVHSHGTRQAATYAGLIAHGALNGRPNVRKASEHEAPATFDGDGGLGYFPSLEAARWVVEPARLYGVAAALTRNHGHVGAAGISSRIVVAADLIACVTSGHQLEWRPGQTARAAAGGSPMSFGVPGTIEVERKRAYAVEGVPVSACTKTRSKRPRAASASRLRLPATRTRGLTTARRVRRRGPRSYCPREQQKG